MAASFLVEVVEGPGAGRQLPLDRPVVVGRDADADLVIDDPQVSRHHTRLTPTEYGAGVVDLASRNGTFVNGTPVHAAVAAQPGDVVVVGTASLELRSVADLARQPSAVRPVPPALAAAAREPDYLARAKPPRTPRRSGEERLAAYFDVRTRAQARLAPVALFLLVALVVIVYLATR